MRPTILLAASLLVSTSAFAYNETPQPQPPFQPTPSYSQLAVGAASSRVALPTGATIAIYNTGATAAFVAIGGSGVTATASGDQVSPGGVLCLSVGSATYLAAIETAGVTALNISGGGGICAGSGGGGPVSDSQSAAFQGSVPMTVGTTYAAGRSVKINATTAGSFTCTLPDSSTTTLGFQANSSPAWVQTLPFACTQVSSVVGTATFESLK